MRMVMRTRQQGGDARPTWRTSAWTTRMKHTQLLLAFQLLQGFRCKEEAVAINLDPKAVKAKTGKVPISRGRAPKGKVSKGKASRGKATSSSKPAASDLLDLQPMLRDDLLLVFVGFNPGIESSRTQHHYAHHTNLFWKLFNRLEVLLAAARAQNLQNHPLVAELCSEGKSNASAADDARLVDVGIGFTDLVLRCTKSASELSAAEKMANVPRVMRELRHSGASHVVIVGKGIWETMVRALVPQIRPKDFVWGLQSDRRVVDVFYRQCGRHMRVFVLPSTSGLVGLVSYDDKLAMWEAVAESLEAPEEGSSSPFSSV